MLGIVTNFKDWVFTKYNMNVELNKLEDSYQAPKYFEKVNIIPNDNKEAL